MLDPLVTALVQTHFERYPEMQIEDAYKLIHQATFGNGHPVAKKKSEREWLEHEFKRNPPENDAPLLERISLEDSSLVRLHIRPYRALRGDLDHLLNAFVESAKEVMGESEVMAERWQTFAEFAMSDSNLQKQFPERHLRLFSHAQRHLQWPAAHHSKAYLLAYRPAYRVMRLAVAQKLCEAQNIEVTVTD